MEVALLSVEDVLKLLVAEYTSAPRSNDVVPCCSCADAFEATERLKKADGPQDALHRIREGRTALHATLSPSGNLQMAPLDTEALISGLFDHDVDREAAFWGLALRAAVDPAHSMRLISLRVYDRWFGTALADEAERLHRERQRDA